MTTGTQRQTLDIVWSKSRAREFFNAHVAPALWPGQRVDAVERRHQHYLAGNRCITLYALSMAGETGGPLLASVIIGGDDFRSWMLNRHGDDEGVLHLPDLSCLVALYPADAVLRGLRHATQPELAGATLSEALGTTVAVDEIDVLRYRPHARAVLRYQLRAHAGVPRDIVVKVYPALMQMERTAARAHLLNHETKALRLPRVLGTIAEWHGLVLEYLPGDKLGSGLKETRTTKEAGAIVDAVAAGMAVFHGLDFASGREPLTIATELLKLRGQYGRTSIHEAAPELGDRTDALLGALGPLAEAAAAPAFGPVHGEFLLLGDRTAVVDLDRTESGDPAIDLGKFMARLDKMALLGPDGLGTERPHLREMPERFLAAYESQAGAQAAGERAQTYRAIVLLRMALERYQRQPRRWRALGCLELLEASEGLLRDRRMLYSAK
jgi:hypothetical protein